MELNINGTMDTTCNYGNERLTNERFTGWTGNYTYDPKGSVTGVTDSEGMIWQSYCYNANGDFMFGKPQYNNVYSYKAESPEGEAAIVGFLFGAGKSILPQNVFYYLAGNCGVVLNSKIIKTRRNGYGNTTVLFN